MHDELRAALDILQRAGDLVAAVHRYRLALVVADAQTGRPIATYSDPGGLGPSFACYSADEGAFTFLHLGETNSLEVTRAEPH